MFLVMKTKLFAHRSLSHRLMFYSVAFTILLLVGIGTLLYFSLKHGLTVQDQNILENRIQTISSLISAQDGRFDQLIHRVEKEWYERSFEHIFVRVIDHSGKTVTQTPNLTKERADVLQLLEHERADAKVNLQRIETSSGGIYQISAIQVSPTRGDAFLIEIALECTSEQKLLSTFRRLLTLMVFLGGLASFWSGRAIVGMALKPINSVSETAARINSERLDERIDIAQVPREFHELALTFNSMLDRLSESFVRLSRFSEDMAHELRTPVNNLLGSMSVALARERTLSEYRNLIGSGVEECERLKRIIDSLLFVARSAEPNLSLDKQELNLFDELLEIVSFYQASADETEIKLELQGSPPTLICANRVLMQRCIGNLLSNSIRHSPAHSKILLNIAQTEGWIKVRVVDQGCGIPGPDLSRIGERFFRVEPSRSKSHGGTGLGLSIVKSIVQMHGGQLAVESHRGQGTTVTLNFPT